MPLRSFARSCSRLHPDPCTRAARMAAAMRARLAELTTRWHASAHSLGFGVGIAHGYATLGTIGFEGRSDYTAIGTMVNLAARLCSEVGDGHILVDGKVRAALGDVATLERPGDLALKGLHRVVPAFSSITFHSHSQSGQGARL
jgi:adenylate cyclase